MKIFGTVGAVLVALVVSVGCGGAKGASAGGAEEPVVGDEPAPAAAADAGEAAVVPEAAAPDAAPAAPPGDEAGAGKPGAGGGNVQTASGYKLQVLPASWSKDQVKDYMKKAVSAGLGVKCDHCHDVENFAADTEKKTIARGMMKMVDDLNKQYFKGEPRLSCITCHNGKPEPKSP